MKDQFELVSEYKPSGDQPEAIKELVSGLEEDKKFQVLLGATGTGKTFTISNVIAQVNRPTLVFAHNKTLAGQLYSEFKEFFPHNRVEYFVSYFDYYQPEAYLPKTDTYIDKNTKKYTRYCIYAEIGQYVYLHTYIRKLWQNDTK